MNGFLPTLAGLLTWLVAGLPVLAELAQAPAQLQQPRALVWAIAFALFGGALWAVGRPKGAALPRGTLAGLVALQVVATLVAMAMIPNSLASVLLVIVASQLAWLLPLPGALGVIAAQTLAASLIQAAAGWPLTELIFNLGVYLGFQLFALLSAHTALLEAQGRARLARLNAELRATQALLSESSRAAERVRIARELHDLLGHHLAALSLNLEVASHLTEGPALGHVRASQDLAKSLLSDVRAAVSQMRCGEGLDLGGALRTLVQDIPRPAVHVCVPAGLSVDDPQRAQVVLRCAQEAVTNAVKHAGAENVWLTLSEVENGLRFEARDDGHGAGALHDGHGLAGMRERLEALGGRLLISSVPGQGFLLRAELPG